MSRIFSWMRQDSQGWCANLMDEREILMGEMAYVI